MQVQLRLAIASPNAVSVRVEYPRTGLISAAELSKADPQHFQLTPKEIIEELNLRRPSTIYPRPPSTSASLGDGIHL